MKIETKILRNFDLLDIMKNHQILNEHVESKKTSFSKSSRYVEYCSDLHANFSSQTYFCHWILEMHESAFLSQISPPSESDHRD